MINNKALSSDVSRATNLYPCHRELTTLAESVDCESELLDLLDRVNACLPKRRALIATDYALCGHCGTELDDSDDTMHPACKIHDRVDAGLHK